MPGQILEGKYRIIREIGRGAMGVVYEALHMALGRRAAIKTVLAETRADLAARFEREARAASAIGHPNIVDVFDLGRTPEGLLFMAMEFLDGKSLATILKQTPRLSVALAVDLARQILAGLAAAHKNGIAHRDLKPDNIFVIDREDRPNFVKILDFGIAKVFADPGSSLAATRGGTVAGTVLGTPLYMPPEQILGQVSHIDFRVDIYATGVVLYEMLCGRPPFDGEDNAAVFAAILDGAYPRPRDLRSEIPAHVEAAIVRALERDREKRFASAAAMRRALRGDSADAPPPDVVAGTLQTDSFSPAAPLGMEVGGTPALPVFEVSPVSMPGPENEGAALAATPGLRIELDRPARKSSAPAAAWPAPARPTRLSRRRSRLGLLLGLLAAMVGARVAYVYLWPLAWHKPAAERARRCRVTLALDPPEAVVQIDHLPAARDELSFDPGTSHLLEATAPGRVSRRISFETKADIEVTLRLGRTLSLPSLADPDASPRELTMRESANPASRDEISRAFAKLDHYSRCLALLGFGEGDTRKGGLTTVPSNSVLSICVQVLEQANTLALPMIPLHAAGMAYLGGASEGQNAGALHRLLVAFRAQYLATRVAWQMEELSREKADDGETAAWHMRRVALAAQTWFRASSGSASQSRGLKEARTRLEEDQQTMLEFAGQHPQEMDRLLGAGEFLKSAQEVIGLARGDSGSRFDPAAAATACRRLLVAFNSLVV